MKRPSDETFRSWLINFYILILLLFTFVVLLLVSSILVGDLLGRIKDNWDVLAFLGSIIGGAITWWGVKKTLKASQSEVLLKSYSSQLSATYKALDEMRVIKDYQTFLFRWLSYRDLHDLERNFNVVRGFVRNLDDALPKLLGIIEWEFYDSILEKRTGFTKLYEAESYLDGIKSYDPEQEKKLPPSMKGDPEARYNRLNNMFWEMNDLGLEIYNDIEKYRTDLSTKYREIKAAHKV